MPSAMPSAIPPLALRERFAIYFFNEPLFDLAWELKTEEGYPLMKTLPIINHHFPELLRTFARAVNESGYHHETEQFILRNEAIFIAMLESSMAVQAKNALMRLQIKRFQVGLTIARRYIPHPYTNADDIDEDGSKKEEYWQADNYEHMRLLVLMRLNIIHLMSEADIMVSISANILAAMNCPPLYSAYQEHKDSVHQEWNGREDDILWLFGSHLAVHRGNVLARG
ncbi:hypothetical protein GGI35DRAFT_430037 [Trichoderma velutinum]